MPAPDELIDAHLIVKQYNATLRREGRIERKHEEAEAALRRLIHYWDDPKQGTRQAVMAFFRNPPRPKRYGR